MIHFVLVFIMHSAYGVTSLVSSQAILLTECLLPVREE
jgi:hypothetical protein